MKRLAIFGTGGLAKEVLDLALDQGYTEIVFLSQNMCDKATIFEYPIEKEEIFFQLDIQDYDFVIAVAEPKIRKKIFNKYNELTYPNLIHSQATLGHQVREVLNRGCGNIIAAGARLTNSISIGYFNIISFNSTVGHDCALDSFISIMPSANISGCVKIEEGVYIGTNAAILPGKSSSELHTLGQYSIIGAGCVVLNSTQEYTTYVGIPARELNK